MLIYFAHSYRPEDNPVVSHFGRLVRGAGLIPVLDPPSASVNAARLQRILRESDGMVAILTRRENSVSPHILFEISMCLQSRKPLIVFIEDKIDASLIPNRVLQRRFSRQWYFHQVRDHNHALQQFKVYLGDNPPPRYQPPFAKQTCLAVGMDTLGDRLLGGLLSSIADFDFEVVTSHHADYQLRNSILLSENFARADFVVEFVDSPSPVDHFVMGASHAAFVPRISLTSRRSYEYDVELPLEYQPRIIPTEDVELAKQVLTREILLYLQSSVALDDPAEVSKYVQLLLSASRSPGRYDNTIRDVFIGELTMGDQYKGGIVGRSVHAHDMNFQQLWIENSGSLDLGQLADELTRLRTAMRSEAATAEQDAAIGQIALAETAAKSKDGAKTLEYLKGAGKWTLDIAEKIGVSVAASALKTALGA